MPSETDELLRVFVQESADGLNVLDGLLLEIEEEPGSRGLVDQFMRAAHTLKGSAGVVGLDAMPDLVHAVEDVVVRLRDGHLHASPEMFDRLSGALDVMAKSLSSIVAGDGEPSELVVIRKGLEQWLVDLGAKTGDEVADSEETGGLVLGEYDRIRADVLQEEGKSFFRVEVPLDRDGVELDAWRTGVLRILRNAGVVIVASPRASELEELQQTGKLVALLGTDRPEAEVRDLLASEGMISFTIEEYHRVADQEVGDPQKLQRTFVSERTVRVELSVLDELLRLVGELMISRDRFEKVSSDFSVELNDPGLGSEIDDSAAQLGHLTSDLQDAIMRARMVPVSRIFRRIKRQVRRVSRSSGRPVPLTTEGEHTELDKNLVDSLADPLARFASSLVSAQQGETDAGGSGLLVTAERRWNQVVLTIVSRGSAPPEQEVENLNSLVSQSGGRLERTVTPDGDAAFVLLLPQTLAIIRVTMTRVGDEVYAFPIEAVQETMRLIPDDIAVIKGSRVVELRGEALSLLFLRQFFGVPGESPRNGGRVLVLGHQDTLVGVVVDEIIGIREVVIKPLSSRFSSIRAISGSAILGDEQIALILDSQVLIEEAIQQTSQANTISHARPANVEQRQAS